MSILIRLNKKHRCFPLTIALYKGMLRLCFTSNMELTLGDFLNPYKSMDGAESFVVFNILRIFFIFSNPM